MVFIPPSVGSVAGVVYLGSRFVPQGSWHACLDSSAMV
jgi:hypothetical protein